MLLLRGLGWFRGYLFCHITKIGHRRSLNNEQCSLNDLYKTIPLDEPRGHCPTSGPPAEAQRGACAPYQICATGKQRFTRHASFNSAQPCEGTKRKVSSEPNSPNRERQGNY